MPVRFGMSGGRCCAASDAVLDGEDLLQDMQVPDAERTPHWPGRYTLAELLVQAKPTSSATACWEMGPNTHLQSPRGPALSRVHLQCRG